MDATGEMRALVAVVEQQSFAAAASMLGLSPSAVSKLVTRLEDRLGVQLLHRTTRRLSLSSDGEVYFARARQILADISEAEIEVTRSRGAPRGRLRINTSNGFGIHQLAPALPDFIARYPDIEIDLSITDRIVDISVDPADVIIRAGPVGDVAALSFKIADFERVVCASPDYLVRQGTPRTPADLAQPHLHRHRQSDRARMAVPHGGWDHPRGIDAPSHGRQQRGRVASCAERRRHHPAGRHRCC